VLIRHRSYQFNPHLSRDETVTNILVKALTVFPSPDFSLGLSLLPSHVLAPLNSAAHNPAAGDAPLSEAVQKLNELRNLLEGADYATFWSTLDSDDLYADLIADVSGFEDLMRVRIAATVSQAVREVDRSILESWLSIDGSDFDNFVGNVPGWKIDGAKITVPINKDNEAKGTVVTENVKFDRELDRAFDIQTRANKSPQNFRGLSRGRTSSLRERPGSVVVMTRYYGLRKPRASGGQLALKRITMSGVIACPAYVPSPRRKNELGAQDIPSRPRQLCSDGHHTHAQLKCGLAHS